MKLSNLLPFQCFLANGASSVLVNYGTVICPTTGSENNIFTPKIGENPIVRFREEGFSTRNLISLSSENSIICLKIYLEDIEELVNSHVELWESVVLDGSQPALQEMINKSMSLELQRRFFNQFISDPDSVDDVNFANNDFLDYVITNSFNPITSWSPKVTSVQLVAELFTDFEIEESSSKYQLIQNDGRYYKLCPIAVVQEAVLTQIIDFDLIFSCPLYWLETLKQPFYNV